MDGAGDADEAKKKHVVMLSSAAVDLLRKQQRISIGALIFPGRGGSRMSYDTFTKAPARVGIDAANAHGWRSTFCAWASGKIPPDLVEHALAHALPPVMAAYKRDTSPEALREMMERYSEWLATMGPRGWSPFRGEPNLHITHDLHAKLNVSVNTAARKRS
jgi:integrase